MTTSKITEPVRTRMAPSPTGDLHVGSLAVVLKNYAWAKRNQGQFVLRIEDTDQERKIEGSLDRLLSTLKKYGLDWDEGPGKGGKYGPYVQSERLDIYQKHLKTLINNGKAYHCFCSRERLEELRAKQRADKKPPKYDRHCRHLSKEDIEQKLAENQSYVVRLKVPDDQQISFNDSLRGEISFNSSEIDDQVLMKSDGFPTYHLAVVIDDYEMKINHVMRGEEWISSTPKHILLYQAFGWPLPQYTHLPLFLNPDGQGKMSKRKGTVAAESFLDQGYLPEATLNFLMILGWTPQDQRELMTLDEYINEFDPKDMSANSVRFDLAKLAWINGIYIRRLSLDELVERIKPFLPADFPHDKVQEILPLIHERLSTLAEVEELTDFFYREPEVDLELLIKKADKELVKAQLAETIKQLENIDWSRENIEQKIRDVQSQTGWKKGQYFMMLRLAITGKKTTPPLFETMEVLGSVKTLERLSTANRKL